MVLDRNHFQSFSSKPMRFLNPHQSQTKIQLFFNPIHAIIDGQPIEAWLIENDQSGQKQWDQQANLPMLLLKMQLISVWFHISEVRTETLSKIASDSRLLAVGTWRMRFPITARCLVFVWSWQPKSSIKASLMKATDSQRSDDSRNSGGGYQHHSKSFFAQKQAPKDRSSSKRRSTSRAKVSSRRERWWGTIGKQSQCRSWIPLVPEKKKTDDRS